MNTLVHSTTEFQSPLQKIRQALRAKLGYENFATNVENALRQRFERNDHFPSDAHWKDLRELIQTIEDMALGIAARKYHLFDLPTGMGKTSTLIETTRELIRIGEETGDPVGILILTNTLEQIPILIQEMGLRDDQFAVRTGKDNTKLNALGAGEDTFDGEGRHSNAQVLFTTQQKLLAITSRTQMPSFNTMYTFTYHEKPRAVRIWDEAILPAQPHTLTADDIDRLKSPLLRAGYKAQRDALEDLTTEMKRLGHGGVIDVPSIELPDPDAAPDLFDDRDAQNVRKLLQMTEGRANIRSEYAGTVALYYEEILPNDFAPLIVLDASGGLRGVYPLWEHGRGNLIHHHSTGKSYTNLKIRHWNHAAGKTAHNINSIRREIAEGIAVAVAEATDDEVLIITRKHGGSKTRARTQNMEVTIQKAVTRRMAIEGRTPPKLHFLTWGKHLATNQYAHIKHVIVDGLLQYPIATVEAMARGSGGLDATDEFDGEAIKTFHKGEMAHHVFQGVGRGASRKALNGDVPPGCKLDIIFPMKAGKNSVDWSILQKAFPGAEITDWTPVSNEPLKTNEQKLISELGRIAPMGSPEDEWFPAPQKVLAELVGIAPVNIYMTLARPHVLQELIRLGLVLERRQGKPMCVRRAFSPQVKAKALDRIQLEQAATLRRRQDRQTRHVQKKSTGNYGVRGGV